MENIIKFLAERESCIIVGRCSDFILSDETNLLRIYIYAPYEERVNDLKMDEVWIGIICLINMPYGEIVFAFPKNAPYGNISFETVKKSL